LTYSNRRARIKPIGPVLRKKGTDGKMDDKDDKVTAGDAMALVAQEGGSESVKLLADLMEYNARSREWTFEQLYLGEKDMHEQTKARLKEANEQLSLISRRIDWLFGGPDPDRVWD
jgi:hypothetical protein